MLTLALGKKDGKEFVTHTPGYWAGSRISSELWNDWKWQLKNRVTSLAQLERLGKLSSATGRTEASLLREALEEMLVKYKDEL